MIRFTQRELDAILGEFLGKPYRRFATGPDAYDCYGLVKAFMARIGVDIPEIGAVNPNDSRPVYEQQQTDYVKIEWPRPWSLVTFSGKDLNAHIGVVLPNDNLFLHCPGRAAGKVIAEPMSRRPWRDTINGYWWPKNALESIIMLTPMTTKRAWQFVRCDGRSLKEIIEQDITEGRDVQVQAFIDGQLVEVDDWAMIPSPMNQLVVRPVVGEGDQAIMMVGMVALAVLAPYVAGPLAGVSSGSAAAAGGYGAAASAAGGSTALAYGLANAAVMMGGALALNALVGPSESKKGDSQHYTWDPQTTQRVGSFIPLVYGTFGVRGNIISAYASGEYNTKNYLLWKGLYVRSATDLYHMKIAYSDGPIEGIIDGTEQLNDKAVEQYDGSDDFVVEHFVGNSDQAASTVPDGFEIPVNQLCYDTAVSPNEVTKTFTAVKSDNAAVVLRFPNGFTDFAADGHRVPTTVSVTFRIRPSGGDWHTIFDGGIHGNTASPVRLHMWFDGTYDGATEPFTKTGGTPFTLVPGTTYEVGITRNNSRHSDRGDDLYFDCVQFAFATTQKHPGLAYTAIGAAASKDISGAIAYYAKIKGKLVRVYDDVAETWSIEWSDNPAWVAFDLLTRPVIKGNGGTVAYSVDYYRRLDPSYLVLADFVALADWCDELVPDEDGGTEKRYVFNGVFDEEGTAWDQAVRACRMVCAMPHFRGHKIGVVIDKPGTPVQMFNVSNLRGGFNESWIDTSEAATVYDAEFYDEDGDYGAESWPVPLLGAANDVPASLDCFGHTKRSRVWRYASRQLRVNQYMKRFVEIPASLDAIYTDLGNIVYVQHPSLQRASGGRVVEVYSDGVKLNKPTELGYYDTGQDPTTFGYHNTSQFGIYFIVKNHLKLGSCKVQAETGGSLVVRVAKFAPGTGIVGDVIAERTFTVASGINEIDLGIVLEPNETGEYYLLYREGTLPLQRGPAIFTSYNFDNIQFVGGGYGVDGTANTYYYYFFNLHVRNPTDDHALLIRTHDGTDERLTLYDVDSVQGDDEDIVVIDGEWEYTPNVNDLWTFGEEVKVIDLYRVKGFERGGDGQVLIQASQYSTDYYADDEEAPTIEAKTYSETKGGIAPSLLPTTAQAVAADRADVDIAVDTLTWEGLTFTGDGVDTVTWDCTDGAGIKYKGTWCPIIDDATGTTDKYVYFDPAIGDPRYLQTTDDLADLAGEERYVFCENVDGIAYFKPGVLISADEVKLDGIEAGATVGAIWGVNIVSQPDSMVQFFYQATEPVSGMSAGDYWQDSDDKKWYRYDGDDWVDVQDTDIQDALNEAGTAQATADGKITTFVQASAPTAEGEGDLWLDSDDDYAMHRWNATTTQWVGVRDTGIAEAIADAATAKGIADGKVTTFYQDSAPTAEAEGDLWIDTDDGNKLYRWDATEEEWVVIQDEGISTAIAAAGTARAVADGKIVSTYSSAPPLVGHWKMNDNAATTVVIDSSGNGHDGAATHNTEDLSVAGTIGTALSFVIASEQCVVIPHHVDLGMTGGGTICMWCKRSASGQGLLAGKNYQWAVYIDSSGYLRSYSSTGTGSTYSTGGDVVIPLDTWVHVAADFSTSSRRLYVNGVDVTTIEANRSNPASTTGDMYIADWHVNPPYDYFTGAIDDVRMYSRVLNRSEILKIYNDGNGTEDVVVPDIGDLWFKTDEDNKPYRWSGSAWVDANYDVATWSKIVGTGKPADGADVTMNQLGSVVTVGAEPGDPVEGQLWLDTSESPDILKRWDGTDTWESLGTVHASWSGVVDDDGKPSDYADVTADSPIEAFRETWENPNDDYTDRWLYLDGDKDSIVAGSGLSGGNLLRVGDNSGNDMAWAIYGKSIAYDPDKLYRFRLRIRRTAGSGTTYFGFCGRDATDTAYVSKAGANGTSNAHYNVFAFDGTDWTVVTFYYKGHAAAGGTPSTNPAAPAKAHEDVRYFRPCLLMNYNGVAGTVDIDELSVDSISEESNWESVYGSGKPEDNATVGATWGVNIADQPDHFMQTFYQDAEPDGDGEDDGDLWVDTNDGNKLYRYVTDEWVEIQDDDVATALENAGTAQATADGKIKTYAQASAPADSPTGTLAEGDLWIDTDDDNKMYRWDDTGSSWEPYAYDVATWEKVTGTGKPEDDADVTADSPIETFRETFENPNNDFESRWTKTGAEISFESGGVAGGQFLRCGNDADNDLVALVYNKSIPYNPNKLYRMQVRCRKTAGTVNGVSLGVSGVDVNGSELNPSGSAAHWCTALAQIPDATWTIYTGYFKGHSVAGDSAASPDPSDPSALIDGVLYFKPSLYINRSNATGIIDVDEVVVEAISEESSWDDVYGSSKPADNADVTADNPVSTFRETFENPNDDIDTRWPTVSTLTATVSVVAEAGVAGGSVLRCGDNSGNDHTMRKFYRKIPFDPDKLYRVRYRVRRTAGTGLMYLGVGCVAADGTTYINEVGTTSYDGYHWAVLKSGDPADTEWHVYTGFIKGHGVDTSPSDDPSDPFKLRTGAAYFYPLFQVNWNGAAGTFDIDEVSIDIMPEDADQIAESSTKKWAGESGADITSSHALDITHVQATAPADPVEGWIWCDTSKTPNELLRYSGSAWVKVATVDGSWSLIVNDGGKPSNYADVTSDNPIEYFRETFENPNSDVLTRWGLSGNWSVEAEEGVSGGNVLRCGNGDGSDRVNLTWYKKIAYDPTKLYRLRIRVRRVSGTSAIHFGLNAYLNTGQLNNPTSQSAHWLYPGGFVPADTFTVYTAYFTGLSAAGNSGGDYSDPSSPAALKEGTAYFVPKAFINYPGTLAGETDIDQIVIDTIPEEASWDSVYGTGKPEDNADVTGDHQGDINFDNIQDGSSYKKLSAANLTALQSAIDLDVPQPRSGWEGAFTNNSPTAEYVAWSSFVIRYQGGDYTIAASNTSYKFIYWNTGATKTQLHASDTFADALGAGKFIVGYNDSGTFYPAQFVKVLHGALIQAATILADHLSVSTLSAITANLGTCTSGSLTLSLGGDTRLRIDSNGLYVSNNAGSTWLQVIYNDSGVVKLKADIVEAGSIVTEALAEDAVNVERNASTAAEAYVSSHATSFTTVQTLSNFASAGGVVRLNASVDLRSNTSTPTNAYVRIVRSGSPVWGPRQYIIKANTGDWTPVEAQVWEQPGSGNRTYTLEVRTDSQQGKARYRKILAIEAKR